MEEQTSNRKYKIYLAVLAMNGAYCLELDC